MAESNPIKYSDLVLSLVLPENVGQASRIGGVRPSDIMVLDVYLKQLRGVSRET